MSATSETVLVESLQTGAKLSLAGKQDTPSNGKVVPIQHPSSSKVDFGAEVYGIDLNNFSDADFEFISNTLHCHKLLVFKEQPAMLEPQQQYKLTSQ